MAIRSDVMVPPFANTAMDGFAVRAADTVNPPVRLRVVGDLPAGRDPAGLHVGPGQAVRIMTGAPIPDGADAVVMVERTRIEHAAHGEVVVVDVAVEPGRHLRAAGDDLRPGDEVVPPFTRLKAVHLGLLATLGLRKVPVFPRVRVGVLSTGDELVEGPVELRPGQIRDSNRPTLLALVREAGAVAVDLGVVGDSVAAVRAAVEQGLESCDVLLTSGGVSMGDWDPVKVVLRDLAGDDTSMTVAIKPAKPLSFGVVDGKPVFGLPGNPASSVVSFELFARPALLAMMGNPTPDRPRLVATAAEPLRRTPDGKLHIVRVQLRFDPSEGRYRCRSAGGQGSHLLRSMAAADGFALVPDGEGIGAGEAVDVLDLR